MTNLNDLDEAHLIDKPAREKTKEIIKGLFEIFGDHLQFTEPKTYHGDVNFTLKLETVRLDDPKCRQSILSYLGPRMRLHTLISTFLQNHIDPKRQCSATSGMPTSVP